MWRIIAAVASGQPPTNRTAPPSPATGASPAPATEPATPAATPQHSRDSRTDRAGTAANHTGDGGASSRARQADTGPRPRRPQPDRPTRRGRLRKDESSQASRLCWRSSKTPSLKDDISELARRVGMPERTVGRWIEKEEKAYWKRAACQRPSHRGRMTEK